jgi:hypothetical protein
VRALGGFGVNGGVQLLALSKMRTSTAYAKLIDAYATRPMRYPMKPGGTGWLGSNLTTPGLSPPRSPALAPSIIPYMAGIGWLGDQTLYSWMSVNGTGGRDVFHVLPCGWNRQIGTHMAGWKGFWASHACATPCHLLHGNYGIPTGPRTHRFRHALLNELRSTPCGNSGA